MVINNTLSEIGDVILFETDAPILGVTLITGYTEEVYGETPTRYFTREFTYSVDGINYYDWLPLNLGNLQALVFPFSSIFKIKYKYTRVGIDTSGLLEFVRVELDGNYHEIECSDVFKRSIFARFFTCNDLRLIDWSINVLEKIYRPGIIPKYIERGANSNLDLSDQDYLSFWKSFTDFFALLVLYSREIGTFYEKIDLLKLYLTNLGIYLQNNMVYNDMYYIMERYHKEISLRGSIEIFKKAGDEGRQINGEYLRLIDYQNFDEFNGGIVEPEKASWSINNSSPLFQGNRWETNIIKGYEYTEDFVDLSLYPKVEDFYLSVETVDLKDVLKVSSLPNDLIAGIGIDLASNVLNKPIIVDKSISYEITFWIMASTPLDTPITFGVRGFDRYGTEILFYDIVTLNTTNLFFEKQILNNGSIWYFCRGIIYKNTQPQLTLEQGTLNLGVGTNLKFNGNIELIIPYLVLDNGDGIVPSGDLYIWDFKVRPLEIPSNLIVGLDNLMVLWSKNNNKQYSNEKLEDLAKYYLFPYNVYSQIIWL